MALIVILADVFEDLHVCRNMIRFHHLFVNGDVYVKGVFHLAGLLHSAECVINPIRYHMDQGPRISAPIISNSPSSDSDVLH